MAFNPFNIFRRNQRAIFAGEGSAFGIPAAKLGIVYGFDMVSRLVSLVGQAHARALLFSGERIDAAEAERIGLVNKVVPAEALTATVEKMTRGMAGNAPLSLLGMKLVVDQVMRDPGQRDLAAVDGAIATCFDSADYREGRTAFMEKRKPVFRGV